MKTQAITISTGNIHDPVMEDLMHKRDSELKELARKNARHFAKRNLPAKDSDSLSNYIGEIKTGYEKLASDVFHYLQPAAHFPDAKMDIDYFQEKQRNIDAEVKEKEAQNGNDQYELGDFNQGIHLRIRIVFISTAIILLGEIIFNTKAFQVTGENMLLALILSICISFVVFVFSHIAPFLLKGAKNRLQRILVIFGSLLLVTSLFTALAIFRSSYLEIHDVHISPIYFVVINLVLFIVSALLSLLALPSWSEIKLNMQKLKIYNEIKKRNKEIEKLINEREKIEITILERKKLCNRIYHHANSASQRIRKMYKEAVEIFKMTNLTFRTDKTAPDCFADVIPEPDIEDVFITVISTNNNQP